MNKSFDDNGLQWAWDATSLTAAFTCPKKYQYSMIEGIAPKEQSVHLVFGGLYASALEHYYKHLASGKTSDEALIEVVREAMINSWDPETGGDLAVLVDNKKNRFNLIRTIVWYVEEFGEESPNGITTYYKADGTPAVELSFSFELTDDIVLCGHLDRVVEYAGGKYVMDQKTTGSSSIGSHYFNQYNPDIQMTLYTAAGQVILRSPVKGVLIDAAQIQVGAVRFARGFTYRTKADIEEFLEDVLMKIREMRSYTALKKFPRNRTACNNYMSADGTGGCPFRAICSAPPHARKQIKRDQYTTKVWDPIERR